jgi:hypothetical protein
VAEAEMVVDDAASVVSEAAVTADEEGADESACPAGEKHAATLPLAAHLPLRKIANRHGSAPLKRIVAACSTLAK